MKALVRFTLLLLFGVPSLVPGRVQAQAPAAPTSKDSLLRITDSSCKWAKLAWTNGDGTGRALVLTDLNTALVPYPDVAPAQGVPLYGSAFFGTGGLTKNGGYAVFTGPGNTATVRNLVKGHLYMALLYPYNQDASGSQSTYLLSVAPDTLRFRTPGCPDVSPTQGATALRTVVLDCSTVQLSCTAGNGQARLFVIRKSNANLSGNVDVAQETYVPALNQYARGFETQPQSGCYAVYGGADTQVTVYGLAPDQIYKWAVYEYNTVPGPDGVPDGVTPYYTQTNAPVSFTVTGRCTGGEPGKSAVDDKPHQTSAAAVLPGTLRPTSVSIKWHPSITPAYISATTGQRVPPEQTSIDGVGSYVVINNALSFGALPLPVQNTVPARTSLVYGQGSPVRPGMDSIYSVKLTFGVADTTADITGLRPGTPYAVNVFTFRLPDATPPFTPYTYFLSQPQATVVFITPLPAPLPVSLVRFTSTHRVGGPQVRLDWTTASELNNAGFGIERSLDGRIWGRLSFVASQGPGSSTTPLRYVALTPYVGAAYYRLRQQDFSGWATYSPISYVRADETVELLGVFPNPTSADFSVSGADVSQPVEVYDLLGRRVLTLPAGVTQGSMGPLPAGVYVLRQGSAYTRLVRQ